MMPAIGRLVELRAEGEGERVAMAEIHDFIFAAIDAHRRVSSDRARFLNGGGEDVDLDQRYCEAAMSAARRLAEVEPATLPGVLAILSYVDEGEQNQGFPWSEVDTVDHELFEWHMTLHRSVARALNRLAASNNQARAAAP